MCGFTFQQKLYIVSFSVYIVNIVDCHLWDNDISFSFERIRHPLCWILSCLPFLDNYFSDKRLDEVIYSYQVKYFILYNNNLRELNTFLLWPISTPMGSDITWDFPLPQGHSWQKKSAKSHSEVEFQTDTHLSIFQYSRHRKRTFATKIVRLAKASSKKKFKAFSCSTAAGKLDFTHQPGRSPFDSSLHSHNFWSG